MRQFVITGHDAPTTPDFALEDLPGGAGRLDLLARCVTSALVLSHGIREDVRVHLVLADQYTVTFDGSALRNFNPDERSTAARVRNALEQREEAIGHVPVETSPGVSLARRGFEPTLEDLARDATVVQLHEAGAPAIDVEPPADPVFVLSDHHDFDPDEGALLADVADRRLSLGPEAIHADHAVTVAHNYLDTDGFTAY
jgi:tRNA (pseudouridine54-N1)-methyltransferase